MMATATHPDSSPAVSVIIVNYNGSAYLPELLDSLAAQTWSDFETLVVDNASSDGSLQLVQQRYPEVKVLPQTQNLGFSRAANRGIAVARGEWVFLLNPDIRLDPPCMQELMKTADDDRRIAAVACKLRLYDEPDKLNGVGGAMNWLGYTWDRGMFEVDQGQYDEPCEVLFASAGASLFRREAFVSCGAFDEAFFMYHEDVDLCWRLWLLGFRVVTAPRAVAWHHFSAATRESQGMLWRELMGERHNLRALLKNYELRSLLRAGVRLLLLRQPWRRKLAQLQNFYWNLIRLPDTLRKRRIIQRQRVRSDRDLEHLIVQSERVPISL